MHQIDPYLRKKTRIFGPPMPEGELMFRNEVNNKVVKFFKPWGSLLFKNSIFSK